MICVFLGPRVIVNSGLDNFSHGHRGQVAVELLVVGGITLVFYFNVCKRVGRRD